MLKLINEGTVYFLVNAQGNANEQNIGGIHEGGQYDYVYSPQEQKLLFHRNQKIYYCLDYISSDSFIQNQYNPYTDHNIFRILWDTFKDGVEEQDQIPGDPLHVARINFKIKKPNKEYSTDHRSAHLTFALQIPKDNKQKIEKEILDTINKENDKSRAVLWNVFVDIARKNLKEGYLDFLYEQYGIFLEMEKDWILVGFSDANDPENPNTREAKKEIKEAVVGGGYIDNTTEEKTEEETEMILQITKFAEEMISSLNINNHRESLSPNRIKVYKDVPRMIRNGGLASINPITRSIKLVRPSKESIYQKGLNILKRFINKEQKKYNKYTQIQSLLNEIQHYYGHFKYQYNQDKNEVSLYRMGYMTESELKNKERHTHFTGFNEAVTEKIAREILKNKEKEIKKLFNIKDREIKEGSIASYEIEILILNKIIEGIAEHTKEPKEKIWEEIKRGYFTGEMMYLRKIEEVFGEKALQMLSNFGNPGQSATDNLNALKFFSKK